MTQSVLEFFDAIWGVQKGFVYLPTKDPKTNAWQEVFFEWPKERVLLGDHVETHAENHDVYFAPAMYSERDPHAGYVLGSFYSWAEFDGNLPTYDELLEANIPQPTIRIRSSIPGREHWYWKFETFQDDLKTVQDINRAITYALDADKSGWDITQLLRPPGTFNHKNNPLPVTVTEAVDRSYHPDYFEKLEKPPSKFNLEDFKKLKIPSFARAFGRFGPWTSQEMNILLKETAKDGTRHKLLTKLAAICAEKGMDDGHIYSILSNVDARPGWRKFANRTNAEKCYISLIDYIRGIHPYHSGDVKNDPLMLPIFNMEEHLARVDPLEYIVEGILAKNSMCVVTGYSDSGKTMLAMDWLINVAIGKDWLHWKTVDNKPQKILFLCLEMSAAEVNERIIKFLNRYSAEEKEILKENFWIYSDPEGLWFKDEESFKKLEHTLRTRGFDILFVDSASVSIASDMSKEVEVKPEVMKLKKLRDTLGLALVIINHLRKPPPGTKVNLRHNNESFGAQSFINQTTTNFVCNRILSNPDAEVVEEENLVIDIIWPKQRLGGGQAQFRVELLAENLEFRRPAIAALPTQAEIAAAANFGRKTSVLDTLKENKQKKGKTEF